MALSPMMQQYHEAKAACGDAILLFRMGDFYELFHEDAKTAARVLGLTLTSREKGENAIPMAGFPHHQLDGYLGKLIKQGYRVAVCDQVEDPRQAKGLVKREITRVVSAGTLTDDALLDPRESNYLAAVVVPSAAKPPAAKPSSGSGTGSPGIAGNEAGVAWVDLSTGRFFAATFPAARLADQLARIQPSECLVPEAADPVPEHLRESLVITTRPAWCFSTDTATSGLTKHFGTAGLDGFGFEAHETPAIRAAGAVLAYLQETQKTSLDHIDRLTRYSVGSALEIDEATRRSLEITRTIRDGRREGTLLAVLDKTVTAMGSRMLGDWVSNPLIDADAINARLDSVEELFNDAGLCRDLSDALRGVYDMERLLARVTTGRASPRDLSFIDRTLKGLPHVKAKITGRTSRRLAELEATLDLCPDIRSKLESALVEDCPLSSRDGGFIRRGHNERLDELRDLTTGGREWIARYQKEQVENAGIPSLKVGYNKVFGYYIEVTNAHRDKVPSHFIRKQTLKNAERYVTSELKEYEEKVLSAEEKSKQLEYDLFVELRETVRASAKRLKTTAEILAELDVLVSLASLARERNYCRPVPVDEPILDISDGRHPVLDVLEPEGTFVPNDATARPDEGMILIITGPNMAGKSTYIRQVALITLMAQIGSFVPARKATIGVADRIFARVGASDELARGQSTFMVEMTETARILNNATPRSLIILDEIGRGTSTYDGLSLAWSIVEFLHDNIGCRTFFATHYHELTDLDCTLGGVRNLNVAVREWDDSVVFLHKIVAGSADKSYGIHVARLAGVPKTVNERAKQVLSLLEEEHLDREGRPKIANRSDRKPGDLQLTLFGFEEHPILDKIREAQVEELTPIAALQLIEQWKRELERPDRQKRR